MSLLKFLSHRLAAGAGLLSLCGTLWAGPVVTCPNGQPADGVQLLGNARHCLFMRLVEPAQPQASVMAVFMHGDNSGRIELRSDRGTAFALADRTRISTVALQRPGYQSELGRSDGYNIGQDDDYTGGNVEIVASALAQLRELNPDKKLLLIGHSGGSAMTALVASRFPSSADAYLVVACPCEVGPWREWRNASAGRRGTWPNSLSPMVEADKLPPTTRMTLLVGTQDDNTLPRFSEAYVEHLKTRGVQARLQLAPDANHTSVLRSGTFFKVVGDMAAELAALSSQ